MKLTPRELQVLRALNRAFDDFNDMDMFRKLNKYYDIGHIYSVYHAIEQMRLDEAEYAALYRHEMEFSAVDIVVIIACELPINQFYDFTRWWLKDNNEDVVHPSFKWVLNKLAPQLATLATKRR
jgi:hypothetical protein